MTNVKFYPFPKPKTNLEKCKQWIKACGRKHFTINNITRSSYVCSKHFCDGKPTEAHPNPYPADAQKSDLKISAKRSASKSRSFIPSKRKKISEDLEPESLETSHHASVPASTSRETQTEITSIDLCNYPDAQLKNASVFKRCHLKDSIFINNSTSKYYTGLTANKLEGVFNKLLREKAKHLNYWRGETENKIDNSRMVALTTWEAFLLTMVRLRRGFDLQHLGMLFCVSPSTASRVTTTWFDFLQKELDFLIKWPTQDILQNRPISAFKYFGNTIAVIDCTEFNVQKASSTSTQRKTWSNYKHHNTLKLLVACTPSGTITFLSKLYTGNLLPNLDFWTIYDNVITFWLIEAF